MIVVAFVDATSNDEISERVVDPKTVTLTRVPRKFPSRFSMPATPKINPTDFTKTAEPIGTMKCRANLVYRMCARIHIADEQSRICQVDCALRLIAVYGFGRGNQRARP